MEYTSILLLPLLLPVLSMLTNEVAAVTSWYPSVTVEAEHRNEPSYNYHPYEDKLLLSQRTESSSLDTDHNQCTLLKVVMNQQQHSEQYIFYMVELPNLEEFTLCMWKKFRNHTNDHSLFSYSVDDQPRSILSWIDNTPRSSYYMMSVNGYILYRLNYPLRLNRWYHSCQSWNGRTGEWQIWVNNERVGRGFNNRLVGHVIKGGGIAISGQKPREIYTFEEEETFKGSRGMFGELTMVQLYRIALTAGKAHRDHKHHHAHHFEHGTNNNGSHLTAMQEPVTRPPFPMNPYLTGGQLNHQVKINPGAHIQVIQNGVTSRHPGLSPPLKGSQILLLTSQQHQPTANPSPISLSINSPYYPRRTIDSNVGDRHSVSPTSDDLRINDYSFLGRYYRNVDLDKKGYSHRNNKETQRNQIRRNNETAYIDQRIIKRESQIGVTTDKVLTRFMDNKRNSLQKIIFRDYELGKLSTKSGNNNEQGSEFLDDKIINGSDTRQLLQLRKIRSILPNENKHVTGLTSSSLSTKIHGADEREPAENEVRRIMNICDGCTVEPFEEAIIISWRNVPRKLYSGAHHVQAIQACKAF